MEEAAMTLHFAKVRAGAVHEIRTTLNYLTPSENRPYSYAFEPPPGTAARVGEDHPVPNVLIRNARLLGEDISLDTQGFALRPHISGVEDFYDEDEVRRIYYPESEQLLRLETGASKVLIFDHTIRSEPLNRLGLPGYKTPVRRVHND